MRLMNKTASILLIFLFFSCQNISDNRIKVARVYDDYLYLDELTLLDNFNSHDSLIFIQNFSNKWASQKLLINKAKFNFKNEPLYIDSLVDAYRESLIIHYYKQAVIQTYLDTIISDTSIFNYYNQNLDNFQLKEDIVKLNYIKVRHVAPNLDFVKNLTTISNDENLEQLEEYCLQFAERFFLGNVNWVSWSDFSKQLPIEKDNFIRDTKKIFKKNRKIELQDSTYRYFLFVEDFKLKGTSSPLEYVSSMIRKILINKRKKEIINNIEERLIQEAMENNNFEIL